MLEQLLQRTIIPVIVLDEVDAAEPLAAALLEGGLDVIEITFRTAAAAAAIERIRVAYPDMLVGAGTVVTPEQARRAIDAGVHFGLAPGLNPTTVKFFQERNTLFIPGVMTPSEIEQGLSLGCKLLKFFPAGPAGGPAMLTALGGPYASLGVKFCPTGGVNLANMKEYLASPIVSNIGGTWLASKQQIADKQWSVISEQVRTALAEAG
jgi:2-dehydro-3-deoxyphosphogluconate aldolase/(4S)-4-hydroxy-2-oxoglutarate aldolase